MKRFAVTDSTFASRVAQLAATGSWPEIENSFARAVFSLITEPGDMFAGAITQALSHETVLELEIARQPTSRLKQLLAEVGALDEVQSKFVDLDQAHNDARQRWSGRLKLQDFSNALDLAIRVRAQLITVSNSYWPTQLDDLQLASPHCLWLRSRTELSLLNQNQISIVGSRISTSYGDWVASEIVADASTKGMNIVSGGAYGIDAISHRAALANNNSTIAFMAGGIDRLYPSGNQNLLERIIENGAVIAEQAPGAMPTKWRFLQRNRLIAAMGQATIVIEAGARSGALNTVTHAQELGRAVGVVPGPITSQASAGCNQLIAKGMVTPICAITDAAALALKGEDWFQAEFEGLGAFETRALDAMTAKAKPEDKIASDAGLSNRELSIALGQLALLGFVEKRERGWAKLALERDQ